MPESGARRERKVVTVVFCDLVGFTARSESLDPEDVEAFLRPYHERVRAELERHGGTVEKFIGDAVMALFGAPVAHEDDSERAVRAALAIREFALEEGLELRVGITTGEALISLDARPAEGEGMASGDVVNTAARLQSAAPVNGVIVDGTTYRATRDAIDYQEAAPVEAKGKSEPVTVWLATSARSRFGVDTAHEARSQLVGRERELATIRDAFERARHDRIPQLLTLVGVPGIGKSRLVFELSQIAEADPDLITWRQGRCLAYGDGVTLWALAEIVKAQVGIAEQDAPAEVAEKLRRATAEAVPPEDAPWVESHLLALVGLSEQAELGGNRRNEAFAAWRRFLEGLAEQGPCVLVFEDLHWADESLLDFVDELVDWIADVPLLVVTTARPELLERRPSWSGGKLNATTIALAPLTSEQTSELLAGALGTPVLPAETQTVLLERAGGNPLYAEQFAELFLERGSADDLPLPETLQGIISARVDALPREEKGVLCDASVVGKVFWMSALDSEPGEARALLHALERKGFVRRQRRSSVEGESELAFAHALVRDVAYGQLPRRDRARRHQRVAEWIESLGRPEDHADMLAYHWSTALELVRASGARDEDLERRTRLALRDAGDRALALNSFDVAASQYEDALELWPDDDAERPDLLLRLARALHDAYDEERQEAALLNARDALLAVGDRDRASEAEILLARMFWDRGQSKLVDEHVARARELARDTVSPSAARVLTVAARFLEISGGKSEEARATAEAALAMSEKLGLEELRAHALATLGMAKNDVDEGSGTGDMERALELALAIHSPVAATTVNNLAVHAVVRGDLARADELYLESARLAERFGDRSSMRFVRTNIAWTRYMRGDWDDAVAEADAFIAECETGSAHTNEPFARLVRGTIREARGDVDGATADLRTAVELARSGDSVVFVGAACVLAALYYRAEDVASASALVSEIAALLRELGAHGAVTNIAHLAPSADARALRAALEQTPPNIARRWRTAILLELDGDLVGAADVLAEMGALPLEAEQRFYAGERLLAKGDVAAAERELARSLAFFRSVGATLFVERAEALLIDTQSASA